MVSNKPEFFWSQMCCRSDVRFMASVCDAFANLHVPLGILILLGSSAQREQTTCKTDD